MALPAAALMAAFAGAGCDRPGAPTADERRDPVDPATLARALGKDAADLAAPVDPPPVSGDFKADLERFTTLEGCVAERGALDPVIGDALLAIGYDTFLRDACRVLDAAKSGDRRRCASIEASTLRARCEAYVAMVRSDPDACPLDVATDRARGHDPTCVAAAARDARLCAGEVANKRAACEALVSGDEKRCARAGAEAARRLCQRDAARWRSLLSGVSSGGGPALTKPSGTLTLRPADAAAPARPPTDLALDVERGVVLVRELGALRLQVGSLEELGAVPRASSPVARPRLAFALRVSGDAPADARIEHLELAIPGALTVVVPAMRTTLKARVPQLTATRGGEVRVIVEGTAGVAPNVYEVNAEIATFVRDVLQ